MISSILKQTLVSLSLLLASAATVVATPAAAESRELQLLFLGDNGPHRPEARFQQLAPVLEQRGIRMKYTDRMQDLTPDVLADFDGLVLYANIDRIDDEQARAVLSFVAHGKGFVPLHCATFCWRNDPRMVDLMGAQFLRHGGQVFGTEIAAAEHPIMRGFEGFRSWDETYIHHRHNEQNRRVLEYRREGEQAEGREREPWTWVRTHGDGRIFYTAWGHDQRTWSNPGFYNLVERGIRWACKDDPAVVPPFRDAKSFPIPQMTELPADRAEFTYVDVGPKIPNYTPGEQWGAQGKPLNMMQLPLSPEESMTHFVTPEGMDVELYADERDFGGIAADGTPKADGKPIAMTWDERGRLWICETLDYPNELGRNRDRIRICEDTDGDHRADRFTVFAEGLSIPTAIVIVRGGAVVQNGTETIYLKDTDGDDRADQKTVLITNWKLGDTHGGVSNFRYGLDSWIWAMQGYNNSTPHIGGQATQTFRQGFWRFKLSNTDPPTVTELEFIRSSNNNTWGLGISEDGLIFGSTANHNPSMFMPIANRYYERVKGWAPDTLGSIADTYKFDPITDKVRQVDQFGGYTAGAGHALYTARAFPQKYWNRTAFVCGPTGHLVGTFVLNRNGANYESTSPFNLLASDDEWSAPIMAEVGPDGAVWVIDWYNYIVQHNPTPQGFETGKGNAYESDLRDKRHGRIYRIVPDGKNDRPLHAVSSLSDASNAQLVETLKHPSMRWRLQAQRMLIERNARDVFEDLILLLGDETVDAAGLNVGAIHALHTLAALGDLDLNPQLQRAHVAGMALHRALNHPSAGVRRNAVAVLPHDEAGLALLQKNEQLFTDRDAQVRLQSWLTLADLPPAASAAELIQRHAAGSVSDAILRDAITSAAAAHTEHFLQVATRSDVWFDAAIVRRVAEHAARSKFSLDALLNNLVSGDVPYGLAVLEGLNAGFSNRNRPSVRDQQKTDEALVQILDRIPTDAKSKVIRLARLSGTDVLESHMQKIVQSMLSIVEAGEQTDDARLQAARDVLALLPDDAEVALAIAAQVTAQTPPEFGRQLLESLQRSNAPETGEVLIEKVSQLTPTLKSAAIGVTLSRPDWVRTLLAGIESREVEIGDLSLDQKQSLRAFPDADIRRKAEELLAMSGGLPDANRDKVLQSLMHLTKQDGNVDRGREMFKKHCSKCHQHGDLGKAIGPNLTGMSVHPKAELLTHIIDPSRSVEGNFRIYTVVREDGRVFNGMLASETRTSLTLIDAEAKETSLQREEIEELVASRKSLMPEGFEKQMTEAELSDLLQFLTAKGKYVPIPLDKFATAVSTKGLFHEGDNGPDRMVFENWKPKMLNGIPFVLTDPNGKSRPNIILLNGPRGTRPPEMPRSVTLPANTAAKAIHFLSGVGGWSYPAHQPKSVSMIVRLNYSDGTSERHELVNGVHFADYIRRVDVSGSEFAFPLGGQQIRKITIEPERTGVIKSIDLIKGDDPTAPIVMAATIER